MAKTPATQKSLALLRADWPQVEVVEHWNSHVKIRQDLFGIIDILAVGPEGTLAVQTTSASNFPSRKRKIIESPVTPDLLAAGWRIEVHGWKKVRNRWTLARHEHITQKDITS